MFALGVEPWVTLDHFLGSQIRAAGELVTVSRGLQLQYSGTRAQHASATKDLEISPPSNFYSSSVW